MPSTFLGLETTRRALSAQQKGMDVSGHNIANANTPGYTRQRAALEASDAYTVPSMGRPVAAGQLGTGVMVKEMQRIRDNFLDGQIRTETNKLGNWQIQNDALSEIEIVFMEPSDNGINTLLSNFWSSWQELSKNAESSPIRTTLIENAVSLAHGFNHANDQLQTIRNNLNKLMDINIKDINSKAQQIANLNVQIVNIKAAGDQPNDLMDKRDLLLDELAKVTNYSITENSNGAINVSIGSLALVNGGTPSSMTNPPDWSEVANGALAGINQALSKLQDYQSKIDTLTSNLIDKVNSQHRAGYDLNGTTNVDFFVGTNAFDIAVNNAIYSDVSKVAAAEISDAPGNGANALAIAQLQNSTSAIGTSTFDNYYKDLIGTLGVEAQESSRMVQNQQALVDQLSSRKESISGVSLDEEMTNLIQYQYAYQGAARVVTTLDSMLDTLINRMAV